MKIKELKEFEEKFCYFCKFSIGKLNKHSSMLVCDRHPLAVDKKVIYQFDWNNVPGVDVSFIFKIKDNDYQIVYKLPNFGSQIIKKLYKPVLHWKYIFKSNHILNVSPENAKQKLPTILTFL